MGIEAKKKRRLRRRKPTARQLRGVDELGTTSLVLGAAGLMACGLCAPFAVMKANEASRLARVYRVATPGTATAGLVLGWIGVASIAVWLVAAFMWLGAIASLSA